MYTAEIWQTDIVRQMFVHTADDNYIGARAAYFAHRDQDFWWLTLHAAEKYLKATLLLNGRSARDFGHEIRPLLNAVQSLDGRLVPPPFERPHWLGPRRILDDVHDDFAWALDAYGHPHGRYGTYSYVLARDDLLKADHFVYWCRRFARPLRQSVADGQDIDWAEELVSNPKLWRHQTSSPIEQLVDLPPEDPRRRPLAEANFSFCADEQQCVTLRGGHAHNAPIYNRLRALEASAPSSDERKTERAVLEWVVENIRLGGADANSIRKALEVRP